MKFQPLKNRKGQGLIEYILVVVLMGIAAITVVNQLGASSQKGFTKASNALDAQFK